MNARSKSLAAMVAVGLISFLYIFVENNQEPVASSPSSTLDMRRVDSQSIPEQTELDVTEFSSPAASANAANKVIAKQQLYFLSAQEYESQSSYGALPFALRGLTIPRLSVDQNGALIANENLMKLIEFFLVAKNEEGRDVAIARVLEYFQLALPDLAAEQAEEVLAKYLAYKENQPDYTFDAYSLNDATGLGSVKTALAEQKSLRREYLGDELAEGFYAYEEAYSDFAVGKLEIMRNETLSDAEREDQIIALESTLPLDTQKRMRRKREELALNQKIQSLRAEGGKEDKIFDLRKEFYGEETAKRITYFDDVSDEWRLRVDDYNRQRSAILAQTGMTRAEQKTEIRKLADRSFTDKEKLKLIYHNVGKMVAEGGGG